MKIIRSNIILLILLTTIIGCLKKKEFPNEPQIELISYIVHSHESGNSTVVDSASIMIEFQDGDGDLGNEDSTKMSMFLAYYEDAGSGMQALPQFDREIYIQDLSPEGNNKAIEGDITINIKAPIFSFLTNDPYQWRIKLIDRAGNFSNEVQTTSQFKQ